MPKIYILSYNDTVNNQQHLIIAFNLIFDICAFINEETTIICENRWHLVAV